MFNYAFRRRAAVGLLALLGGLTPSGLSGQELPEVRHLRDLGVLSEQSARLSAHLELEGVVCEADPSNNILVLADQGAAEVVNLPCAHVPLSVGQRILITGQQCEVLRRRVGIGLRGLPLVDNDGSHGVQEKDGAMELTAGVHPIYLEWFNAGGAAALKVEYSGPQSGRRPVPASALSPTETGTAPVHGLLTQVYYGVWRSLPDFESGVEAERYLAPNFQVANRFQEAHVGCTYSGFLTVTQAGTYHFYVSSDDGSRLFLGDRDPEIRILEQSRPPEPRPVFIGELAGTNNPGTWATVEGFVNYASPSGRHLELDLRSPSNNRMQVDVLDGAGLDSRVLLGGKIRLNGVSRQVYSTGGQSIRGLLTVLGSGDVTVLDLAEETWQAFPPVSVATALAGAATNGFVHLTGRLQADEGGLGQLADPTGRISLENYRLPPGSLPRVVEALGRAVWVNGRAVLRNACVRETYGQATAAGTVFATARQILKLPREEAMRGHPVHLQGVVTCVWPNYPWNCVLQDGTHGIFVQQTNLDRPEQVQFGEFWEAEGVTGGGAFSPVVLAHAMRRLGDGRLPEPAHAEGDELVNGSLDNQYVEIEGIILQVKGGVVKMLLRSGPIEIQPFGQAVPSLAANENSFVRLRGCMQAVWDSRTHQVKTGVIKLGSLTVCAEKKFSSDPFNVPAKRFSDLRLYDEEANAFKRVKLTGCFLAQRGSEGFALCGTNGLRFITSEAHSLRPGDTLEISGVPDLRGVTPVLREAVVRRTGAGLLPLPQALSEATVSQPGNDATRVRVEGLLTELDRTRDGLLLALRAGNHTFAARLAEAEAGADWEAGSRLSLAGTYVWQPTTSEGDASGYEFEVLVPASGDIRVLSRPPWWTFKKLLLVFGVLSAVLVLAALWIVLLRRQVERRTRQLEQANRKRDQAERARALDEERLRIARDLHDDLGSSLTEITMLGSVGLAQTERELGETIGQMVKKARNSVNSLDVIVWAVNPRENTLQSFADYLAGYADEFLGASNLTGRLNLPVSFPEIALEGRVRHDLFLAAKEALNNAVRHSRATVVELGVVWDEGQIRITVSDNGCGFDPASKGLAHGLGNMRGRLEKLGGECAVSSTPGGGTVITLKLDLQPPARIHQMVYSGER